MHSSYNQAYSGILYLVWSSETCWYLCSQLSHMSASQGKTCQVPWSLTASGNTIFCLAGNLLGFCWGLAHLPWFRLHTPGSGSIFKV
jgi:hypothetical protein